MVSTHVEEAWTFLRLHEAYSFEWAHGFKPKTLAPYTSRLLYTERLSLVSAHVGEAWTSLGLILAYLFDSLK